MAYPKTGYCDSTDDHHTIQPDFQARATEATGLFSVEPTRNLNGGMGGLPNDRPNVSGWEASASFNVNDWFGLEADFSGHYYPNCETVPGLTCKDLSFMGGPRFTYRKERYSAFTYALVGGDNGSGSISGISLSDTPFAFAAGGGVDYSPSALTKNHPLVLV
jgi:hypothetical protein